MSFVTDVREVSESAIEQLADRFDDLPRPLLAAIGAGDLAAEGWAALRESVLDQFADGPVNGVDAAGFTADLSVKAQHVAADYAGRVQQAATDLPQRAQSVAAEFAESIQAFAAQLPAQAQGLIVRLPEKISELSGDLTVETLRDTVNAYTELVGAIYGGLADRGVRTWSRIRSSSLRPGTVVDAAPSPRPPVATPVTTAAPKTARAARSAGAPGPRATTRKPAPKTATTIKPADGPSGTTKPRAPRAATADPAKPNTTKGTAKPRPKRDVPTGTPHKRSHSAADPTVSGARVKPPAKAAPVKPAEGSQSPTAVPPNV